MSVGLGAVLRRSARFLGYSTKKTKQNRMAAEAAAQVTQVFLADESGGGPSSLGWAPAVGAAPALGWLAVLGRARRRLMRLLQDESWGEAFALDFTDRAAAQALFEEGAGSLLTDGEVDAVPGRECRPRARSSHRRARTTRRLARLYGSVAPQVRRAARARGEQRRDGRRDGRRGRLLRPRRGDRSRPPLLPPALLVRRLHVGRSRRARAGRRPPARQRLLLSRHLHPRRTAAQRDRLVRQAAPTRSHRARAATPSSKPSSKPDGPVRSMRTAPAALRPCAPSAHETCCARFCRAGAFPRGTVARCTWPTGTTTECTGSRAR